ncbi:MAG: hypothetical protein ACP5OR_05640 [Candidatus Dormibacteria bacterium]
MMDATVEVEAVGIVQVYEEPAPVNFKLVLHDALDILPAGIMEKYPGLLRLPPNVVL